MLRFFQRDETNPNRTIFDHNPIRERFGLLQLIVAESVGRQIDRAAFISHVERDGLHVVKLHKCGRENVLSRVLLHVIATAQRIDEAADLSGQPGLW